MFFWSVNMENLAKYQQYAEKITIFKELTAEEVAHLLKQGRVFDYPQGKTIFYEGQLGSALFVILSGKVGLYKKAKEIAVIGVGDVFGEMSVLNKSPRTASAVALTPVRVFTMDEHQLSTMMDTKIAVRFLMNIIHVLSERLERMNKGA